jgi:hypothetical protein
MEVKYLVSLAAGVVIGTGFICGWATQVPVRINPVRQSGSARMGKFPGAAVKSEREPYLPSKACDNRKKRRPPAGGLDYSISGERVAV